MKLCYLVKSSGELKPSDGGSEEVLLSTNRLSLLHCTLHQHTQTELRRAGPVTKQRGRGIEFPGGLGKWLQIH